MAARSRKKVVIALVLAIAAGIFLPPNINGNRLSKRLTASLKNAIGRDVSIGQVKFRLLPRPGFDLYNFQVLDDPQFNAEPLLMCGKVTADLRLTSLWQGRLEIANLKLQNDYAPPSLNLVYAGGHWNLESLLLRAEQVPSAPTGKKRAEQRVRFPYIEADGGRINIKVGPEKKPYALTNTDFALWLASENQWHVRLEGRPLRTDMNLNDTGRIRIEGDLQRASKLDSGRSGSSGLRETPVKLQLSWQQGQLGQLSSLVLGHDKGWRGGLNLDLQLVGSLADMHVTANGNLENLRRYDIDRTAMMALDARCLGEYSGGLLDFNCNLPVDTGNVSLSGKVTPGLPPAYDLSLLAHRLPLSAVATFARHARRTLPDDLSATGALDANFSFRSRAPGTHEWRGLGMTSPFLLTSASISEPIEVSGLRFSMGSSQIAQSSPHHAKSGRAGDPDGRNPGALVSGASPPHHAQQQLALAAPPPAGDSLTFEPFRIQLGTESSAEVKASADRSGYEFETTGTAPLERILELGKVSGFPSRLANTTGAADFDFTVSGVWGTPPHLEGIAHLHNVDAAVTGIKDHLQVAAADAQLTEAGLTLSHMAAQFHHSRVVFRGSVSRPVSCQTEQPCVLQLDLHADALATEDIAGVLGLSGRRWNLPFLFSSEKFPDVRASGTLTAGNLKLGHLPLQKFMAHLEFAERSLALTRISAKLGGGATEGNWKIDWSTSPVHYSGTGTVTGVSPELLELPVLATWISGKTSGRYSVNFTGANGGEMLAAAAGQMQFVVSNGTSEALTLEGAKPARFQLFEGSVEMNHAVLQVVSSKLRAENRIYELSGTVSLADKQAKLTASDGATQWEITGALENPLSQIAQKSPQQPKSGVAGDPGKNRRNPGGLPSETPAR